MEITAKSFTIKLDNDGSEEINEFIDDNNLVSNNFKELFFDILRIAKNKPLPAIDNFSNDILEAVEVFKDAIGVSENAERTTEDYVINALRREPETINVPAELKENQLLIEFSEVQLNTLEQVRQNRIKYRSYYRKPVKDEPNDVLIKNWIFNKGVLRDFGETFYTGIK